jgi:DNA repair exonuclease SbcCD ATPase subunit
MEADEYMDHLEQRVAELEMQADLLHSARQENLGRIEARDNIIEELKNDLRDMTAACDLWKKRAQAAERTFILCYRLQQDQGAKLDRAVEALKRYASKKNWHRNGHGHLNVYHKDTNGPYPAVEALAALQDGHETSTNDKQTCPDCDKLREDNDGTNDV